MSPLVSIIIPCYNAERWVGEAIQSCLDQIYSPIEIIVVDDGSTDKSLEIVKSFGKKIRWETGFNAGVCAARNRGFRLALGEFVQFLDADDALHPLKIALSVDSILKYPQADFVWAPHIQLEGKSLDHIKAETATYSSHCIPILSNDAMSASYSPWAAMFRKSFLSGVGIWNENLTRWVDWEYHARIVALSTYHVRLACPLYYYRQHDGPRISDSNKNHTNIEAALLSINLARRVLEKSTVVPSVWKPAVFPFYAMLARSAAITGNSELFEKCLKTSFELRQSLFYSLKCRGAILCSKLFGIRLTSMLMETLRQLKSHLRLGYSSIINWCAKIKSSDGKNG